MKKFYLILALIFVIVTISGCSSDKNKPENQVIKYNLASEPKSFDPQISDDYSANVVLINIFEGLTRLDAQENIMPGVATHWENNNNAEFIFHLRENTHWSDGTTPVTAHDFVFGFRRAVDPNTQAPHAASLFCIKNAQKINNGQLPTTALGVSAADDHTLKVELEYQNENFPKIAASIVAMPCNENFFNSSGGQYGLEAKTTFCNGAFKLKKKYGWAHSESVSLVKNEGYAGETLPISAGINFSISKDSGDPLESIKNGIVDAALIGAENFDKATSENMPLNSFEDTIWALTFNFSNPTFQNFNIRKSIFTGFDKNYAVSRLPENYTLANGIVLSDLQTCGSTYKNVYSENIKISASSEAKKFLDVGLAELGLKELPSTNILCLDTPEVRAIVSNIIEHLNKNLNFHFSMVPVALSELLTKINNQNFQIALCPITPENDDATEFFNIFTTNNKNNFIKLNDDVYDNLISQAYSFSEKSKVDEFLSKAEIYLSEKAILYPFYTEKKYFATAKNVSGIVFHKYKKGVDFINAQKKK